MRNLPENNGCFQSVLQPCYPEDNSRLLDLRLAPLGQNVLSLGLGSDYHQTQANLVKVEGSSEDTKISSLSSSMSKEGGAVRFPSLPCPYTINTSKANTFVNDNREINGGLLLPSSPINEGNTPTSANAKSKSLKYLSSSDEVDDSEEADGSFKRKLRLDKDQFALLEEIFAKHQRLAPKHKAALAKQLNVRTRQIEVWFQNRRARTKVKQTELEREKLKAHCDALVQENHRLQMLVQELKASQAASAISMRSELWNSQRNNITVSVCPSCQRISNHNSNNSSMAHYDEVPNAIVISQQSLEKKPLNLL